MKLFIFIAILVIVFFLFNINYIEAKPNKCVDHQCPTPSVSVTKPPPVQPYQP